MACYGDSHHFLYKVEDVGTSQETHLWLSAACYGDSFNFFMQMIFVPYRKHTYGLPQPVTRIALILYADDVRASQETHLWAFTASYVNSFTFHM
jgi:hypothetical protein